MKNKKLLLKKSFKVRRLVDVFLNSRHVVLLHVDSFFKLSILKKSFLGDQISFQFINKGDVVLHDFSFFSKGPTLLVFSDSFFLDKLENIFRLDKLNVPVVLLKMESFLHYGSFKAMALDSQAIFSRSKAFIFSRFFNYFNYYPTFSVLFLSQVFSFYYFFFFFLIIF